MTDTCEIQLKLSKADFSTLGLGDKHFRIEADHGHVVEVIHSECNSRGEELREQLDTNNVLYLGSHGNGADHGWGAFASDGVRNAEVETDQDGTYLVPADNEGVVDNSDLAWLREFTEFQKSVATKLGLCLCCELPPDKCRANKSAEAVI